MMKVTMKKYIFFFILLVFASSLFILYIIVNPDLGLEIVLTERMGYLSDKLKYELEIREKNLGSLYELVQNFLNHHPNESLGDHSFHNRESEILKKIIYSTDLFVPSIYSTLPQLINSSVEPAIRVSKLRSSVDIVLGVPTVKRSSQSYLMNTLQSLFDGLATKNISKLLIVVLIGETDSMYVASVVKEIQKKFFEHLDSGLIDVISPPAKYYPNFGKMIPTMKEDAARFKWRSKQCLDFVYLLMYSYRKGTYYVHLEDDVIAKKGYFDAMVKAAGQNTIKHPNWFLLSFSQLGFIGKMFKNVDLPIVIQFFLLFYTYRPIDWLISFLLSVQSCQTAYEGSCGRKVNAKSIGVTPSLFQHVGLQSSLAGKTQKLKDKKFGQFLLHISHKNPPATVYSNVHPHKGTSLKKAYSGGSIFFGYSTGSISTLNFEFKDPLSLAEFSFQTGDYEYPRDVITNGTVEALPSNSSAKYDALETVGDYIIIGRFDEKGVAKGRVDSSLGLVKAVRLRLFSSFYSPIIFKEIYFKPTAESD